MIEKVYRVLHGFCGSGGGALGFSQAKVELHNLGLSARFECAGGVDFSREACNDFERLTGGRTICADVLTITPEQLRALCPRSPDVSVNSSPCKASCSMVPDVLAATPKYVAMNELALVWTRLLLSTWDEPPRLLIYENVPRIVTRAAGMLKRLKSMLIAAGYVLFEGFHDCGEIGGLSQHRRRWLLVARHVRRLPALLYQPPRRRVRSVGELFGDMPMPGDPEGGKMHGRTSITLRNAIRLALIPAGGDWRDLDGVLAEGQARREVFRRHHVGKWGEPSITLAGPGSNGPCGVADPRVDELRVKRAFDHGYGVLRWQDASWTIAGGSYVGQGAYAVADPRRTPEQQADERNPIPWLAQIHDVSVSVADPRFEEASLDSSAEHLPAILSPDGTHHRPFTALELLALQLNRWKLNGAVLELCGDSSKSWRERTGNMIPATAGQAIAEQMLGTLLYGDAGAFSLSANPIWVAPEGDDAPMVVMQ